MRSATNPWGERVVHHGRVDFTVMYAAHDAFSRDLRRLSDAIDQARAMTSEARAGWETFKRQLHIHHQAEDASLWPPLRAELSRPAEIAVLDDMEDEHAQIDPYLEDIDRALTTNDPAGLRLGADALIAGLGAHMRHEENVALPLVDTHLGPEGWAAMGTQMRRTQGLRGAAEFFPWILDGAPEAEQRKVLSVLPAPARLICKRVWTPRYRRTPRWTVSE